MNKNAFEIRLNILQMAHADAQMKYLEKLNTARDNTGKVTDVRLIDALFPKSTDVIARAEELYKFVEGPKGL